MAISTEVIRRITIQAQGQQGVDSMSASLNKLAAAQGNVAVVSDTSSKRALSAEQAYKRQTLSVVDGARAQDQIARATKVATDAFNQGILGDVKSAAAKAALAQRITDINTKYGQASASSRAYAAATQAANDNLRGFAQAAGPVGSILSAFGPGGIAAAAGIGAAAIALHQMVTAAISLAERAGKLKDFAETTGFTIVELQALEKAGAAVGVTGESVSKGLERFSVQMAEVKLRTGETFEKLLAINPEMARQVATAESLQRAYELVSKAIKDAPLEQANQLARAFFGRGGVEQTRLMRVVADAGGLKGVIAQLHQADIITKEQAERWDTLGDTIAKNMKDAKQNIAAVFTEDVLTGMERFSTHFLDFSRSVREFGINEDFKTFIGFFTNKTVQATIAGALGGGLAAGVPGFIAGGIGGAIGGQIIENADAKNAEETARQLDILNNARDRAIQKLQHYQTLAAAPDNLFAAQDAQRAEEYGRILGRVETRIKALGTAAAAAPTLPSAIEVGVNKVADAQEALTRETRASYNDMQRWMGAMGSAATMAERYETSLKKLDAEKANGQLATNKSVSVEESYARKLADLNQHVALSLGVADMAAATEQRLAQVREVAAKAGLTDEQTRLALGLAQREAKERELQAWSRLNPEMAAVRTASIEFASGLAKDLAQGVNLMDALTTAAGRLGETLIDIGTKKLVSMAVDQAASMFGGGSVAAPAAILNTTAVTMGATWVASAQIAAGILAGESVQEATARVTSAQVAAGTLKVGGAEAGLLMNGPMMLLMAAIVAVGAALSSWSGASAKAKQEEEAQARAWEQWQAAGLQLASYFAKANGTSVGNIRTQLQEQQSEAERFIKLRSESQGFKSAAQENNDPVIREIRAAYGNFSKRLKDEFQTNFAPTIEAMRSGFGEDSPIFQAFQNVKSVGETLQAFIADAEFVFGKGSGQAGEARGAAQTRAISLLQGGGDPLSEVQKRMQEIQGTARGLQKVLEDLGMSSVDAAQAISDGVGKAIDALRKSFTEDLQKQINDLSGNGYFNDAFDLLQTDKQRRKDNTLLGGGNEGLIDQLFGLSAQGIVDQFKLTGDAFQEFIKQFPELAGKIKEFDDVVGKLALQDRIFNAGLGNSPDDQRAAFERKAAQERMDAAKNGADYLILLEKALGAERARLEREIQEAIMQERRSLEDRLFSATNDTSTDAGKIAEFERKAQREREEAIKNGSLNILLLEQTLAAERAKLIDELARVAAEGLQRRIQSFQDMTFNALNDTTTLEGQLAALAREENRAREQEAIDGNGALAELNEAFFARELAIRKSFGDRAIEEVKRVAEAERQAKNQAAKTVLEYLAGRQSGPNAIVSPQENFANSLAFYTSNLAFAQGNPSDPVTIEAVNKFPQVADNLDKAARALFGSGVAYQNISNQIDSEGLNLPTVQQADDPLVVALRNTVTAVDILSGTTVTTNTGLVVLTTNTGTVSSRLVSLGTDLTSISGDLGTLATDLTGVSTRAGTLANDLGGPGGVSQRMVALSADLGGTGGVSQRLLDLASTVGTGNDTSLRAKMISLAGEVAEAGTKAGELATDADSAAAKARDLARDAADAALKATNLSRDVADAALKAIALATAIGTSDNNGVLRSLKLFGDNLSDIATQLLLHFNELDIDRSGAISRGEFTTSLGNTADVNSLFTSLDINGDNNLTQMELMVAQQREANRLLAGIDTLIQTLNRYIAEEGGTSVKAQIADVSYWSQQIRGQTGVANVAINKVETATVAYGNDNLLQTQDLRERVTSVNSAVGEVQTAVNTVRSSIGDGTGGGSLQELTKLLTFQLTGGALSVGGDPRTLPTNVNNNMILALNKIVWNTYATAYNTDVIARFNASTDNTTIRTPTFAQGGVIPPHSLALVSEHLNPTFLRAGPEPITVSPYAPAFGRAANDNGALLAEIRALKEEFKKQIEALRKEHGINTIEGAKVVREAVKENTAAVRSDSKVQASESRQTTRQRKVASR